LGAREVLNTVEKPYRLLRVYAGTRHCKKNIPKKGLLNLRSRHYVRSR
jgi:hypothetical protein